MINGTNVHRDITNICPVEQYQLDEVDLKFHFYQFIDESVDLDLHCVYTGLYCHDFATFLKRRKIISVGPN